MKLIHKAVRFENSRGYLEIRFIESDGQTTVDGHWKTWDHKCYHNTPLVDKNGNLTKSDGYTVDHLTQLVSRMWDVELDFCDVILKVIEEEIGIPKRTPFNTQIEDPIECQDQF